MKIGEYLEEKGVITNQQLGEALLMQRDNPSTVLGQVLVTMGVVTKEELIMLMEMYLIETESDLHVVDEWLDQEEIDMLLAKLKK